MIGGRDYTNKVYGKFNLATEAVRQPGSSFKPFVLIAALEEGILPRTQFNSHRLLVQLPGRSVWSVKNDEGAYRGDINLGTATTFSDNTVYAQLALRIGTERIRRVAHEMGVARPIGADPAIALGGLRHCCTPIEMALAYSTLANRGMRVTGSLAVRRPGPGEVPDPTLTPIAIRRVEDSTGKVIDRNTPQKKQAISRESALTAIEMLRNVVRIGTAKRINDFPRPAAGKTGTTEQFVDAWFVGMTPTLTTAVWNGFPTIRVPMLSQFHGEPVFGGTYPALLWKTFTQAALNGSKVRNWPGPTTISGEEVMIDTATGKRAGPNCPRARALVMAYAKIPTQFSSCAGTVIPTPEVTDLNARQAQLDLDRAGLLPQIRTAVPPAGEAAGKVFAQNPEPGEPIELGTRVYVSVAKAVTWVTIPKLIGYDVVGGALGPARRGLQGARDARLLRQAGRAGLLAVPGAARAGRQGLADHADRERRHRRLAPALRAVARRGRSGLTYGESSSAKRHGTSVARLMPMRGVWTIGPGAGAVRSSMRPAPIASPSSSGPIASAWPRRPGPRQSSSSDSRPRRSRIVLDARSRLERADQHCLSRALLRAANDVEQPVDAVAAVHVRTTRRAEHARVAAGRAGKGVRRGIVERVGLALGDDAADAVDEQLAADQRARQLGARARAEAHARDHAGDASTRDRARRVPAISAALQTTRPKPMDGSESRVVRSRAVATTRAVPLRTSSTTIWSARPCSPPTRRRKARLCPETERPGP